MRPVVQFGRRTVGGSSNSQLTVLITHPVHADVSTLLASHGLRVLLSKSSATLPRERVRELARDADGMMAFMPDRVDAAFLDAAGPRSRAATTSTCAR